MRASSMGDTAGPGTILITGASTGLGLALARKLLNTEHRLILTAREGSLPRFASAGVVETARVALRSLDVTVATERERVIQEATERWGGVDVLVNNAAIAYRTVVEHVGDEERRDQMNVNFHAPMELIRLVLPRMREKRHGQIINVSSVGGMMAMPTMSLYSASKFALEGATEALWYEVRPWNIKVSLVQPGFIHSDSFQNTRYTGMGWRAATDPGASYHTHYQQMATLIARLMNTTHATPEDVAEKILRTIRQENPPLRIPATWDAHVFAMLRRLLPRRLYHEILYRKLPHVSNWGQSQSAKENQPTSEPPVESHGTSP